MAQQQKNITIGSPGFAGINTEMAGTEQNEEFASIIENGIVDSYGRLGARKGVTITTSDGTAFAGADVEVVHAHTNNAGVETVLSCADNKIFKGEGVPADITPVGATITDNAWQCVTFNDDAYFVQAGHTPIVYDDSVGTASEVAVIPESGCCMAAYGRFWVGNETGLSSTIAWSGLLDGSDWVTAGSGDLNVAKQWPTGYDEVVAMAAHNGFLIIFGRENILIYGGAEGDVSTNLALVDTVKGIGCISRDSVQNIGTDILWLDSTGIRSFNRTVQEKSMPIGDVSANVKREFLAAVNAESDSNKISATYSPEESFYLLLLPDQNLIYCFDTRHIAEGGAMRVTTWVGIAAQSASNSSQGRLIIGGIARIGEYSGYQDAGFSYSLRWYSNPLSFGSSAHLKFPKQIDLTLLAGNAGTATVKWAYNYSTTYRSRSISLTSGVSPAEYGIAEWGANGVPLAEYGGGASLVRKKTNVGGSGEIVTIGLEVTIDGEPFSLQEINIQALMGRIT